MKKTARTIVPLLLIAMQLVFPFHSLADCCAAWEVYHGLPPLEDFDHRHVSNGLGQSAMLDTQAEQDGTLHDLNALAMVPMAELMTCGSRLSPISLSRIDTLDRPLLHGRTLRAFLSSFLI